jgi:hypothetical protein
MVRELERASGILWGYQRSATLDFSRPGKPTDKAFIESFNGKFRGTIFDCALVHEASTNAQRMRGLA